MNIWLIGSALYALALFFAWTLCAVASPTKRPDRQPEAHLPTFPSTEGAGVQS